MKPDAVVASLQLLAAEAGTASCFICSFVHLDFFLTQGTAMCHTCVARAIHAAVILSQKTEKKQATVDREKTGSLAIVMSIHIAENNSTPLGMSGHLHAYLYLFSLFKQGQLSQGSQGMEFMALLFSTCFLNYI